MHTALLKTMQVSGRKGKKKREIENVYFKKNTTSALQSLHPGLNHPPREWVQGQALTGLYKLWELNRVHTQGAPLKAKQ